MTEINQYNFRFKAIENSYNRISKNTSNLKELFNFLKVKCQDIIIDEILRDSIGDEKKIEIESFLNFFFDKIILKAINDLFYFLIHNLIFSLNSIVEYLIYKKFPIFSNQDIIKEYKKIFLKSNEIENKYTKFFSYRTETVNFDYPNKVINDLKKDGIIKKQKVEQKHLIIDKNKLMDKIHKEIDIFKLFID